MIVSEWNILSLYHNRFYLSSICNNPWPLLRFLVNTVRRELALTFISIMWYTWSSIGQII